jgi:protein kinase A
MEKLMTNAGTNLISNVKIQNIQKFNINEFEIGDKFSKVPNGYIAMAKKTKTNQLFSIKVLRKSELLQSKLIEHELNQCQNLSSIYHPFIIELKGINNTDPYNLFYLYEFIAGVNLKQLIKINSNIPTDQAKFYIASLITVLDYLHKKKIISRDIRPENVLVNSTGYIKLSEFTLSKKLKDDYAYSLCGIPEYYSPEMINQTGYNKSIDFWQLGVLLYEMLVGYTPFIDSDPVKLFQKIKSCKLKFPKNINKNAKTIIRHFLIIDINKRLGCTKKGIYEITQNPFFQDFDWEGLLHRNIDPPYIPKVNHLYLSQYKKLETIHLEDNLIPIPSEKDPFFNW